VIIRYIENIDKIYRYFFDDTIRYDISISKTILSFSISIYRIVSYRRKDIEPLSHWPGSMCSQPRPLESGFRFVLFLWRTFTNYVAHCERLSRY